MRSLGILGGTFNPPHVGHLALARHALDELALERVLLMPAHIPPHKRGEDDPGPAHRLAMCRLAVADAAGLGVSALELERAGPSYTADTLKALHASQPDAELTFIMGADTAATLPSWREPREVLRLARLAVAARTGTARRQVLDVLTGLGAGVGAAVSFLEMPAVEVSSSMARGRVLRGEAIDDLVGAAVAAYIAEHGLYRARAQAAIA